MLKSDTKKVSRKKSRHKGLMLLRVALAAIVLYASVSLIDMQINLTARRRQVSELEQRVETQRIANKELERQLAQGMGQEDVERIARERLGFISPDETVFVDVSGK